MILDYSKKELEQIAKLYGVKGAYKLKKAELVEALVEAIPAGMADNLPMLDKADIERFEALMKESVQLEENESPEAYYNLMELELVQLVENKEGRFLVVDELIKTAYSKINVAEIMPAIEANEKLRKHVMAILNLYGIVKVDWAVELYNKYHEEAITEEELVDFAKKDMRIVCQSKVMDGYLVEETIYALDKNNFQEFLGVIVDKPYYTPSKEMLAKLVDETYYENTLAVEKLKAHLRNNFTKNEEMIEDVITAITMIARVDSDRTGKTMELMLEEMANIGIEFKDLAQINEVIKHIVAVVNNTRKWINKGFTANELSPHTFNEQTGQKVKVIDIGRNAPCPCGSGKKYKKCCGK